MTYNEMGVYTVIEGIPIKHKTLMVQAVFMFHTMQNLERVRIDTKDDRLSITSLHVHNYESFYNLLDNIVPSSDYKLKQRIRVARVKNKIVVHKVALEDYVRFMNSKSERGFTDIKHLMLLTTIIIRNEQLLDRLQKRSIYHKAKTICYSSSKAFKRLVSNVLNK